MIAANFALPPTDCKDSGNKNRDSIVEIDFVETNFDFCSRDF
jgi:hypothetical protein